MERLLNYHDNRSEALLVAENAADGERRNRGERKKEASSHFPFYEIFQLELWSHNYSAAPRPHTALIECPDVLRYRASY